VLDPGLLNFVQNAVLGETFDGRDLGADRAAHRERAGARGDAIDMHGAGAALRDAAAVFGAGQADVLADRPEQGRFRLDVDIVILAVDVEAEPFRPPQVRNPADTSEDQAISKAVANSNWTSSNQQSQSRPHQAELSGNRRTHCAHGALTRIRRKSPNPPHIWTKFAKPNRAHIVAPGDGRAGGRAGSGMSDVQQSL